MYPGEKYDPPEEDTPPSSPKQLFFEDVVIQRSKHPRHLPEKFGIQVLPVGPVLRKSTPEHVFRENERQEEFQNHTFKKSSSFRRTENVDDSVFRKSWSQRLPGSKPIPPAKPPRQISDSRSQSVAPRVPPEPTGQSGWPTTPPVPPAKPVRLFIQISTAESSEVSKDSQESCINKNEKCNGNSAAPPIPGDSSSVCVIPAVCDDAQATSRSNDQLNLQNAPRISDNVDECAEKQCASAPVPSPRHKSPFLPEYDNLENRSTVDLGEQFAAALELHENTSDFVTRRHSRQIKEPDKISSYESTTQSEVARTSTSVLPTPPKKPVRTSLIIHGTQSASTNTPKKKRIAPQPPPKPRKLQVNS
ncbi:hypothetical protein PR048_002136 [Dryococelus australis]|uniref:Uncharacterized protein n=1 Tax=Dryococelus australis TaxID=614101 RepID=A0ABQ9IJD3_9NEOP|nr:hypothetical protein PR048_002136 [Dryococelus australis]